MFVYEFNSFCKALSHYLHQKTPLMIFMRLFIFTRPANKHLHSFLSVCSCVDIKNLRLHISQDVSELLFVGSYVCLSAPIARVCLYVRVCAWVHFRDYFGRCSHSWEVKLSFVCNRIVFIWRNLFSDLLRHSKFFGPPSHVVGMLKQRVK